MLPLDLREPICLEGSGSYEKITQWDSPGMSWSCSSLETETKFDSADSTYLTKFHLYFKIFISSRRYPILSCHILPMPGRSPSKACPCLTQCHRQLSAAPKWSLVIIQEVSIATDAILLLWAASIFFKTGCWIGCGPRVNAALAYGAWWTSRPVVWTWS